MRAPKARVRGGPLVVDEAVTFPEGTELDLVIADAGDDLDDEERAELHAELHAAWEEARNGELVSAASVLEAIRRDAK